MKAERDAFYKSVNTVPLHSTETKECGIPEREMPHSGSEGKDLLLPPSPLPSPSRRRE
jgi:hypothetical protein